MIAVVPYTQDYNETDDYGRITRPKGVYVAYGVDLINFEQVCLPDEEFYNFVRLHCYLDANQDAYILK